MKESRLERTNQGFYYFRKHNGIRYELNEGCSIGSTQSYSSDIVYIMLESYDELPCQFIGWCSGCDDLENGDTEMIKFIDDITDEWEKKNPEITKNIIDGLYTEI